MLPNSEIEDILNGFNTLLISSLKWKENTLKFGQNVIFFKEMFLYLTFIRCFFAMIEKIISKKREYLSRNNRLELGHRIWPTLSVITKKPKSFRRWNFKPYLPAMEAALWLNFVSAVLRYDITVLQKVSGNIRVTNCTQSTQISEICRQSSNWTHYQNMLRKRRTIQFDPP